MNMWRGGGLIYLFVAYPGGVSMLIHHFCWGRVRQNSCSYFLYRYHVQLSNPFHVFFAWRENLWEPRFGFQLHLTISNKDAWAAGGSVLTGRVFHLLVSNPNLVAEAQHLSIAVPGGKPCGCGRQRLQKYEGDIRSVQMTSLLWSGRISNIVTYESRLSSDRPLYWFALPHSRLPLAVYRTRWLLMPL